MGHPRTDPQFDPLEFERLLNHRMTGALQFGDRMSGGEIFLERKAALGDRIVRRRDADIVGIEQKPLIELSGKLRQETEADIDIGFLPDLSASGVSSIDRFSARIERPEAAIQELAFMPTVANPPNGPAKPYIMRGVSLVPDEMRLHIELEQVQYLPAGKIMDPLFEHHKGFTRAQGEIVAGRVSALNECFY